MHETVQGTGDRATGGGDMPFPYKFYAESEWRIVYTDLLARSDPTVPPHDGFPCNTKVQRCSCCVQANAPGREVLDYLHSDEEEAGRRLRYLLPLDGWLSCIIFPSVSLKQRAIECTEIKNEIKRIKEDPKCRANSVEKGNWPVEMDLDLCRNF
jgi:hypothetical protein